MALGCVLPVSCSSPLKVCSLGAAQIKQEPPSCEYIQADPRLPVMCEHKMRDSKISVLKSTKMVLEDLRDQQLTSWTSRHPQHWSREQVLDWIYYVVEQEHLDGSRVRGEAYQSLTGSELCTMTEEDFRRIDPDNGSRLSAIFRHLLNNVTFIEPKPAPEGSSLETFNREHSSQHNALSLAVCSEAYAATRLSPCGGNDLIVYERENEMQVDIPSLGTYSISPDIEFPTTPSASSLFRSSASRLASSASFTSPPPSSSSSSVPSLIPPPPFEPSSSSSTSSTSLPRPPISPHRSASDFHSSSFSSSSSSSSSTANVSLSITESLSRSTTSYSSSFSSSFTPSSCSSSSYSFSSSLMSSRSTPPSSSSSSSLSSSFTSRRPSHAGSTTSTKSPSSSASQLLSSTSSSSLLPSSSPSPSSSLSISMCVNVTRNPSSSSSSSSLSSSCRMDVMDSGYISDDSMHGPSYLPPPPGSDGPHHLYPGCPPGSDVMSKPAGNAMSMGHMTSAYACAAGVPGEQRKKPAKKHRSNAAKNNHLWEFVRDLLHDPKTNPKLLTWEDEERGVFRFVQSDKVAELWGEKKNNKEMTYEKLSRAMRFCRSAGYFAFVPKNERFPKKLCFMFGHKAHGWKQ